MRREQAPDLLELRMACLDDRLRELGAASRLLATADAQVVTHASSVAAGIAPLAACADAHALREPTAPKREQLAQINRISDRLAAAQVAGRAGRLKPALAELRTLLAETRKLDYAPLESTILLTAAHYEGQNENEPAAEQLYIEAAAAGLRGRQDRLVALPWIALAEQFVRAERHDSASLALLQAKAASSRVSEDLDVQIQLGELLSMVERYGGDPNEALRIAERTLALAQRAPDHIRGMVEALGELELAQEVTGHHQLATETQRRALGLVRQEYGAEHPATAYREQRLAGGEIQIRRSAEAQMHLLHAIGIFKQAYGEDSISVSEGYIDLGYSALNVDPARALSWFNLAASLMARRSPNTRTAQLDDYLGSALQALGRLDEARDYLEQGLALAARLDPAPTNPQALQLAIDLGSVLVDLGSTQKARPLLERALAEEENNRGTYIADALFQLGRLESAEGHVGQARRLMERSIPLSRDDGTDTIDSIDRELSLAEVELFEAPAQALARVERIAAIPLPEPEIDDLVDRDRAHFLLAKARVAAKDPAHDLASALQLAHSAREGYAKRGARFGKQLAEVERWLALNATGAKTR